MPSCPLLFSKRHNKKKLQLIFSVFSNWFLVINPMKRTLLEFFTQAKNLKRQLPQRWSFQHHILKSNILIAQLKLYWEIQWCKKIVDRRHGEPIKFLYLTKMVLLGSQAGNEKKCCLWIMSNFWGLFFHVFMGKNYFSIFFLHCRVRTKKFLDKKMIFFFF